jgi:hypothetical protein
MTDNQAPIWDPRPIFLSPWDFLLDSCGLHISGMYIQYIQGLLQSRLGTANYALVTSSLHYNDSLVTWTVIHMTAAKFKLEFVLRPTVSRPVRLGIRSPFGSKVKVKVTLQPAISRPVRHGVRRTSGTPRPIFLSPWDILLDTIEANNIIVW